MPAIALDTSMNVEPTSDKLAFGKIVHISGKGARIGFIKPADGTKDIFFHFSGARALTVEGDDVVFNLDAAALAGRDNPSPMVGQQVVYQPGKMVGGSNDGRACAYPWGLLVNHERALASLQRDNAPHQDLRARYPWISDFDFGFSVRDYTKGRRSQGPATGLESVEIWPLYLTGDSSTMEYLEGVRRAIRHVQHSVAPQTASFTLYTVEGDCALPEFLDHPEQLKKSDLAEVSYLVIKCPKHLVIYELEMKVQTDGVLLFDE